MTDHKKGNDSRFNDNSSADGQRKQAAKLNIMFAPASMMGNSHEFHSMSLFMAMGR